VSKLKSHVYHYDEVVIGGDINAVLCAYKNENVILLNNSDVPFVFDFCDPDLNLKNAYFENINYVLKTTNGDRKFGIPKCKIWKYLVFLLSLQGLNPIGDKIKIIRLEDDNFLKITTEHSRLVRIKYNKLKIFDDKNVYGLKYANVDNQKRHKVLDWMDVRSGTRHAIDYLKTDDNFIKEIYFYSSLRIDGNNDKKDLVSVSYLTEEELQDFNFSSTIAKFKIIKLMDSANINGSRNGRLKNKEGYAYSKIKIEAAKREVLKTSKNIYDDYDDITFNRDTFKNIVSNDNRNDHLINLSNRVSQYRKFIR